MIWLFSRLMGRLPIGWMQLWHNRTRLAAATGGVMFANVLIFMQLGFMNALFDSSVALHRRFQTDLVLVGKDFQSLGLANPFPRARALEALSHPAVSRMVPIHVGTLRWTNPETMVTTQFRVLGLPPDESIFQDDSLQSQVSQLAVANWALLDAKTRQLSPELVSQVQNNPPVPVELQGITLQLVQTFRQGASFETDGHVLVSDDTFLRLFSGSQLGAPTMVLLTCEGIGYRSDEAARQRICDQLEERFPERDTLALTHAEFVQREQDFQGQQKPVGFVFMFGVVMGLVVGMVIVYQVLATDVQDHLKEYATFKAMGYSPRFFTGIILEEALSLAILGFIPALGLSLVLYRIASRVTSLPIEMTWQRPLMVLTLTFAMCTVAGLIALRRLRNADPAELF